MTSSGARRLEDDRNCQTRIGCGLWALAPPATFKEVFAEHYDRIAAAVRGARAPGYAILAFTGAGGIAAERSLSAVPRWPGEDVVVIGRHDQAQLQLDADFGVALRHLLVRASLVDARPQVRVLDLKTGQGFSAEGAGLTEALTADGPLYIALGSYGLVFMPVDEAQVPWPATAAEAWPLLPERRVVDARKPHLVYPAEPRAHPRDGRGREVSRITLIQSVSQVQRLRRHHELPPGTRAVVTVEGHEDALQYTVTDADLELGVLLGRYERCDVSGQVAWQPGAVSRVHALLLKEGERVWVIDTASTYGTIVNGQATPAAELGAEAVIELAEGNRVFWRTV